MVWQRTAKLLVTLGHRTAICLVPAALSFSGCAQSPARSLSRVWEDIPKIRWSLSKEADLVDRESEALFASKAGKSKTDDSDDGEIAEKSPPGRSWLSPRSSDTERETGTEGRSLFASRRSSNPHDPFLEDELATRKRLAKVETESAPQIVSQRGKLKAALSDDTRRGHVSDEETPEQDRLRLRVESFMERARYHLERDELTAAQRAVELAQNLAESAELEFVPDEERPIDLLTTIMGRRRAESEAVEQTAAKTDDKSALKSEKVAADELPLIRPAGSAARTKTGYGVENTTTFDPYADRHEPAEPREDRGRAFGKSMVVLEVPSFDDDPSGINPTAFIQHADRTASKRAIAVRQQPLHAHEALDEIPAPPISEGPSFGDADAPVPPVPLEVARSASTGELKGPRLSPPSLSELEATLDDDADEVKEIRPAGVWPRWMPLSLLSLFTAAFCAWLLRRRMMNAA